jgi:predicted amidohydrolase YtcJ
MIINATLIDALNPAGVATTVSIENGEIQSILSVGDLADIQETDILVDAQDKFLIPGLSDAHVHLIVIPELDFKTLYDLFLSNGVTRSQDISAVLDQLKPAPDYATHNSHKAPRFCSQDR